MESLLSQFSFLANQALNDKNFDPSEIEQLMNLFEQEAFDAWEVMEAAQHKELKEAEATMRETEAYLNSLMDAAMDEVKTVEEIERHAKGELQSLVRAAKIEKSKGESIGKAATNASKKYMEAAMQSATASFKSARNGISSSNSSKVHPR